MNSLQIDKNRVKRGRLSRRTLASKRQEFRLDNRQQASYTCIILYVYHTRDRDIGIIRDSQRQLKTKED